MLLELAIGDAYGAGFEYVDARMVRDHNDLSGYVQHPRHKGTAPGCYTDDTQMTLAIVETMVSGRRWSKRNLAEAFVAVFQRDPREGYAGSFHGFLQEVRDGDDFLERIRPQSETSGAAMRAGPLGLYPSIDEVMKRAELQATLTHDTPRGIVAAQAAALLTHYCHHRLGARDRVLHFLAAHLPGPWATPWQGKVGHLGVESVAAAATSLRDSSRMSDLLRSCVAWTGDVDTAATIALCAGSRCDEMEQDLPTVLHDGLERGRFGYDYLRELDEQLRAWTKSDPTEDAV